MELPSFFPSCHCWELPLPKGSVTGLRLIGLGDFLLIFIYLFI